MLGRMLGAMRTQVGGASIEVVSVGEHARLLEFHRMQLELLGNGEWRICRSKDA